MSYLDKEYVHRVETIVNRHLWKLDPKDFRGEAINWADLHVCEVTDGRVTIEEASPDSERLKQSVSRKLEEVGLTGITVITEW